MEENLAIPLSPLAPSSSAGSGSSSRGDGGSDTARTLAALDAVVKRMASMGASSRGSSTDPLETSPASPTSSASSAGGDGARFSLLLASSNWSSGASIDMSEGTLETVTHTSGGSSPLGPVFKRAHSHGGARAHTRGPHGIQAPHGTSIRRAGSMADGPLRSGGGGSPENKSPTLSRNLSPLRLPSPGRMHPSPNRRYVGSLEFDITPCIMEEVTYSAKALISDIDRTLKKQGSANRLIDSPLYTAGSGRKDYPQLPGGVRRNSRVLKVQSALGYVSAGDLEGVSSVLTKKERMKMRQDKSKAKTMDCDS